MPHRADGPAAFDDLSADSGRDAGRTSGRGLPLRNRKRLLEPVGDPAASQVVGAEFDLNPISWRDADSMET
jgi:hypothetical protein